MYQADIKIKSDINVHELAIEYTMIEAETDVGFQGGPDILGIAVNYKGQERRLKNWSDRLDEYLFNYISENH